MYPYTKELTLDEALNILTNAKCQSYEKDGKVYLTALDYATHILKQQRPPEGWWHAAYPLDSGRYDLLEYMIFTKDWNLGYHSKFKETDDYSHLDIPWNNYAFKLTDLAKVEASSEMEPTEESARANVWPERPDAIRPAKQEQTFGQFVGKVLGAVDWEAKYNESCERLLEAQNTIAIQEKRIRDLEHYKSISDDYVKAFERRDTAKDVLKQAEINLIEARSEYYPY
jgi:hypothetical protein